MVPEVGHVVGFKVVTYFLVKTGVGLEVWNNREHVSFKHHKWTTSFVSGGPMLPPPICRWRQEKEQGYLPFQSYSASERPLFRQ